MPGGGVAAMVSDEWQALALRAEMQTMYVDRIRRTARVRMLAAPGVAARPPARPGACISDAGAVFLAALAEARADAFLAAVEDARRDAW
jgi:hypothetical protein